METASKFHKQYVTDLPSDYYPARNGSTFIPSAVPSRHVEIHTGYVPSNLNYICVYCDRPAKDHDENPEPYFSMCSQSRSSVAEATNPVDFGSTLFHAGTTLDTDGFPFNTTNTVANYDEALYNNDDESYNDGRDTTFAPDPISNLTYGKQKVRLSDGTMLDLNDTDESDTFRKVSSDPLANWHDVNMNEQTYSHEEQELFANYLLWWDDQPEDNRPTRLDFTEFLRKVRKNDDLTINPVHTRSESTYVDGDNGYAVTEVIDLYVTRLTSLGYLNIFRPKDKPGTLRVGGISLTLHRDSNNPDNNTVTAACVWDTCNFSITVSLDSNRELMETFTLAVIIHGNNHTAKSHLEQSSFRTRKWYRSPDMLTGTMGTTWATNATHLCFEHSVSQQLANPKWYPIHKPGCTFKPGTNEENVRSPHHKCSDGPYRKPLIDGLTNEETIEFLQEHDHWCSDSNCKHSDWIAALGGTKVLVTT